ncbi:hypothetical protein MLD38_027731 [Melastoma candidum]|uniref:Uncharacterized protein n=1 Tax=Melastoma candidum TaxID=119954 RepID=A0ACB9P3M2_9MYRT|nr:hypothetical protein MLD38_027731 [Melastoma candidum]
MTQIDMIEESGKTTKESLLPKRVIMCTISICVFAFLLCSRNTDPFFPHSLNICFSTGLFAVFMQTFERKYMFLVCYGILAILARSCPDLKGSSSFLSPDPDLDVPASITIEGETLVDENVIPLNSTSTAYAEDEGLEQQQEEEPDQQRMSTLPAGTREDKIEAKGVIQDYEDFAMEEDELEDEAGGGGGGEGEESLSNCDVSEGAGASTVEDVTTEELNRRIEEFIRKMKAEIQMEAQSQLIAV